MMRQPFVPHVRVEGLSLGDGFGLTRLQIIQRLDVPSQCELCWSATTARACAEMPRIDPGVELGIYIEDQSSVVFRGTVTAVEYLHGSSGEFILRLRAYDALEQLQRQQTTETQVEITTAELLRALVSGLGLHAETSANGPIWPRVIPRFNHDLALLRSYTSRSGLNFYLHDDTVHLFSPRNVSDVPLELTLGDDLLEANLEHNALRPLAKIHLHGWNPHSGEPHRAQLDADPDDHSNRAGEKVLLGATIESDAEATSLMAAELNRSLATTIVLSAVADGNTALRPGRSIKLSGVATEMEGPYLLRRVEHIIDSSCGYICELDSRPEQQDAQTDLPALISAEVCDSDDPEARGRVQVTLECFADAQTTWLPVVQIGAGRDKGILVLPEIGDRVLVALPDGNPSRGIVLGGLFHDDGPPDDPAAERRSGAHRPFSLVTRGGLRIRLNDADDSIHLRNSEGSFISLSPEGIELHAEGKVIINAPGEQLILGADRIDLQRR